MKHKPIIVGLLCCMLSLTVFSQKHDPVKIMKEMEKMFENAEDISGTFKYGIGNYTNRTSIKQGEYILKKEDKFYIKLNGQEIYCDGEKQWIYFMEDNEVNILNYEPDEGVNIDEVFNLYKNNAKLRYDGEEVVHGVACHKIYLAFSDEGLEYNQAVLWIDKKEKNLEKAVTIDRLQTKTTYEFLEMNFNKGFEDSQFVFDAGKYPGITVYDETD